jgi:hypothetical protein
VQRAFLSLTIQSVPDHGRRPIRSALSGSFLLPRFVEGLPTFAVGRKTRVVIAKSRSSRAYRVAKPTASTHATCCNAAIANQGK